MSDRFPDLSLSLRRSHTWWVTRRAYTHKRVKAYKRGMRWLAQGARRSERCGIKMVRHVNGQNHTNRHHVMSISVYFGMLFGSELDLTVSVHASPECTFCSLLFPSSRTLLETHDARSDYASPLSLLLISSCFQMDFFSGCTFL